MLVSKLVMILQELLLLERYSVQRMEKKKSLQSPNTREGWYTSDLFSMHLVIFVRFLVIVFYHGDWECQEHLQAFSDLREKFRGVKAEVVGCSVDSSKGHLVWMKTDK